MTISGLKLTIPKGRVAELKKNHLELAESTKGSTKSTGAIFGESDKIVDLMLV